MIDGFGMTEVILRNMKTAISLPDHLFLAADRLARRLGITRSELYQRALTTYVERHDDAVVTAALDEVYTKLSEEEGRLDPALAELQRRGLDQEKW